MRSAEQGRDPRAVLLGQSPKTISNAIVVVKKMFADALEWDLVGANPAAGIRRPRATLRAEETMHVLDPLQVRRLLDAAEGQERTLLLAAVTTGVRRGELLGLRWSDVDRERNRFWVRRSVAGTERC